MEKASAAAAVGAAGVPEYHPDKLRDAKFIRELALNPYNWKDSVPIKPGKPSHRVIAATMHGSAPSARTTYNPAYVPPNMIVIMTTAGPEETIGQQIYVTPSLYNNILR
jgi:hypothetical protein